MLKSLTVSTTSVSSDQINHNKGLPQTIPPKPITPSI